MRFEGDREPQPARFDLARALRILAGDREALESFFEGHSDAVYRFAVGRLGDEELRGEPPIGTLR